MPRPNPRRKRKTHLSDMTADFMEKKEGTRLQRAMKTTRAELLRMTRRVFKRDGS